MNDNSGEVFEEACREKGEFQADMASWHCHNLFNPFDFFLFNTRTN